MVIKAQSPAFAPVDTRVRERRMTPSTTPYNVSARYRRTSRSLESRQYGGTSIGILVGIVIGLAIAVVTALFVTRTTLPFVGLSAKPADKAAAAAAAANTPATAAVPDAPKPQVPVAVGDVPDPNRTAAMRQRTAPGQMPVERREIATVTAISPQPPPQPGAPPQLGVPAPSGATPNPPATVRSTVIPGSSAAGVGGSTPAPIRAATPSVPAAEPGPSAPAPQAAVQPSAASAERGASYLLQAGAFRGADDADAMKLRLALMGLEAQIVTAEISGTTLYRVRVGPYAGLDAMTRARARLAENGVEASVLRQR